MLPNFALFFLNDSVDDVLVLRLCKPNAWTAFLVNRKPETTAVYNASGQYKPFCQVAVRKFSIWGREVNGCVNHMAPKSMT